MTADQLRKSILQQAIQGKLVPQDSNDEPASALLERIREEKARLVKEKKIKKEKNPSIIFRGEDNSHYEKFILTGEVKCIDDEIPFDLPQGWEWCRLGDVALVKGGKRVPNGYQLLEKPTSHIYIRVTDMKEGSLSDKNLRYISDTIYESIKTYTISKDDLYLTIAGSIGKVGVVPPLFDGMSLTENAVKLTRISIFKMFLYHCICSELVQAQFHQRTNQVAQPKLAIERIESTLIPLPPLAEQQRIVAKIEELIPLIEQYGKAQNELEVLNSNIREQLKKSVLQYAIEGKLVPQCEKDGTTEDLLQEIQAEKQRLYTEGKLKKKDLTHSTIFRGEDNKYYEQIGKEVSDITEEIPYDLPNGWSFCRLSVLCWLDDGSKHFDEILPYLDAKYQRGHSLPTYIQEGRLVEAQSKVILIDGENSGEVFITRERGYLGSTFKLLQSMPQVSATWMQYVLENYRPLLKGSKVGAAIPHLNKKLFHNLIIGLPCRKEQEFIAEQLDSMFQLIEG